MTYRDATRKLSRLGCRELPRGGGGSHRTWHNPATGGVATLPDHRGYDLKIGTLRAAVRGLGIDWADFERA